MNVRGKLMVQELLSIHDADDDGVCDADEITGCQHLAACNFDENATDAGSCVYNDAFGICDGDGTIQGAIDNPTA